MNGKPIAAPNSMTDALIGNITGLGIGQRGAVGNLFTGGQLGTGVKYTKLDAATPLAFTPAVIVVLHTPSMWDGIPDLQMMLKSMVETHAKSVTGIEFNYAVETAETPIGHDGQTLKIPTRSTRGQISPSIEYTEVTGNLCWNLHRRWIFDMQHPDTNASALSMNTDIGEIPPWVMTAWSMSFLAIQYDATMLPDRIIDAAFYTNVFPTDIGPLQLQRVINTTNLQERTIQYTGIVQHNENIRELAYQVAVMLRMHQVNYNLALPGILGKTGFDEAIQPVIKNYGISDEVNGGGYNPDTVSAPGNATAFQGYRGINPTNQYYQGPGQLLTESAPAAADGESYRGTTTVATDTTEATGGTLV